MRAKACKRTALVAAFGALLVTQPFLSAGQCAENYPSHAVRIIVPFGAGGPADVAARVLGDAMQDEFKQPFVIENRPGAGAIIGTQEVVKSAPDGYTLLLMSNTQTANESLMPTRKYELMRDLVAIAPINIADLVIVVHPSVPATTLKQFIGLAKSQPGKLNYASSGTGTPYHMAAELFKAMTDINVVHVPYRNSGEARSGVIGGQVQMMIDSVTTMAPNVVAGQVRALATTGKSRSAALPDVPTVSETVPGFEASGWAALVVPKGTPDDAVATLNAATNAGLKDPAVIARLAALGGQPFIATPAEIGKLMTDETAKWAKVIKFANIKLE